MLGSFHHFYHLVSMYRDKGELGYPKHDGTNRAWPASFYHPFRLLLFPTKILKPKSSNNALGLQRRFLQLPARPLEQTFLTGLLKLLHFPTVFPLDPLQQQGIAHKE